MRFFPLLTRGRRGPKPFLPYTDFSAFFFVIGCILVGLFSLFYNLDKATKEWPSAEGVVSTSRVVVQRGKAVLDFEYRFTVRGAGYSSRMVNKGQSSILGDWATDSIDAGKVIAKYPARAHVTVYYNPANPRDAVLEHGITRSTMGGLALGILLMVSGVWLYFKRPFREIDKLEHYEQNIRVR